jgi:hypothetical protein
MYIEQPLCHPFMIPVSSLSSPSCSLATSTMKLFRDQLALVLMVPSTLALQNACHETWYYCGYTLIKYNGKVRFFYPRPLENVPTHWHYIDLIPLPEADMTALSRLHRGRTPLSHWGACRFLRFARLCGVSRSQKRAVSMRR